MTYRLSQLYELAGMSAEAARCTYCSTFPSFGTTEAGRKFLARNNSCHLRLCPVCSRRRAHNMAAELSRVLDLVVLERPNTQYVFLTLTIDNPAAADLRDELGHLSYAWNKLVQHREIKRAIGGWFRALEITREKCRWGYYHPHIHAILAVGPEYFDRSTGLYLTHAQWLEHWRVALDVPYKPSVRIQRIVSKTASADQTSDRSGLAAAKEAAKYSTKHSDYITSKLPLSKAAEVVRTYSYAIKGKRMHAYGGWLAEAARDLESEKSIEELDHARELRGDIIVLMDDYHWSFGARDYVLEASWSPRSAPAATEALAFSPPAAPDYVQLELNGMSAPAPRRPV